jgi:hypothetical protein
MVELFELDEMDFQLVSEITDVEVIATGKGVRDRSRLR